MYRQGDVLIIPVQSIPKKLDPIEREGGRIVLAHGEVTGHAHAITAEGAALFRDPKLMAVFMTVSSDEIHQVPRFRDTDDIVGYDDFGDPMYGRKIYGHDEVVGVALEHDEHDTIIIPPGNYQVIRQREYHPQEIRNVAD